jgi:phosphoglycerol transferase MdoB-like AlkP superfamily enzyme
VADEDLYTLTLEQLDQAHARGQPLFAHVMTTSNHRPYTFPTGRGEWPQGERNSAVAYTDWAVGDFLERARTKPWFANTLFVITADHCAASSGKAALPVFQYHIPMWIYAPGLVAPGRYEALTSQIDIAPTILGLLGMDYRSQFYGVDVFQREPGTERAFIGTYQLLGYLRQDKLVQLGPHRKVDTVQPAYLRDQEQPALPEDPSLTLQAISFYQVAAYDFTHGNMRNRGDAPVVPPQAKLEH